MPSSRLSIFRSVCGKKSKSKSRKTANIVRDSTSKAKKNIALIQDNPPVRREITVKNAEGDADTKATILHEAKLGYTPKISVIIPVYNAEEYLRECLDSVVNQTLKEIEIICIDDGSTDTSLNILKEYAKKDNRFTIIIQVNSGPALARNNGINQAQGNFIAFMDADDFYPQPTTLKKLYDSAILNNVKICGGSLHQCRSGKIITDPKEFDKEYEATA